MAPLSSTMEVAVVDTRSHLPIGVPTEVWSILPNDGLMLFQKS